jgi:hypothetical protein
MCTETEFFVTLNVAAQYGSVFVTQLLDSKIILII